MDTIREKIISAVETKLATLLKANGFSTDCGKTVARAASEVDPETVVVVPRSETAEVLYGRSVCTTQITVDAFLDAGEMGPSKLQEQMLGDLIRCLTNPAAPVTPLADEFKYVEGGPAGVPDAAERAVAVAATFEVKYKYQIGNPYQQ